MRFSGTAMQPMDDKWRSRLLRRLAIVCNDSLSYQIRRAAVIAVQAMMGEGSSIHGETPDSLLDRVSNPWDRVEQLRGGRYAMVTVSRPPRSLRDVWS
jgi:hypothetical protein